MVHLGGIKASILAGSFTFVAAPQDEPNFVRCGGGLSTIFRPISPLSHFKLVSNLEWSGVECETRVPYREVPLQSSVSTECVLHIVVALQSGPLQSSASAEGSYRVTL